MGARVRAGEVKHPVQVELVAVQHPGQQTFQPDDVTGALPGQLRHHTRLRLAQVQGREAAGRVRKLRPAQRRGRSSQQRSAQPVARASTAVGRNLERRSKVCTSVYSVERRTKGTQQKRLVAGATRRSLVEVIGFEPTAPSLRTKCSARLSYTPRDCQVVPTSYGPSGPSSAQSVAQHDKCPPTRNSVNDTRSDAAAWYRPGSVVPATQPHRGAGVRLTHRLGSSSA